MLHPLVGKLALCTSGSWAGYVLEVYGMRGSRLLAHGIYHKVQYKVLVKPEQLTEEFDHETTPREPAPKRKYVNWQYDDELGRQYTDDAEATTKYWCIVEPTVKGERLGNLWFVYVSGKLVARVGYDEPIETVRRSPRLVETHTSPGKWPKGFGIDRVEGELERRYPNRIGSIADGYVNPFTHSKGFHKVMDETDYHAVMLGEVFNK